MFWQPDMSAPIFSNHGCRLNAYETEAMKELARRAGVQNAIVVNTCAVTAEAVRKAKQDIRKLRRANPDARIIVTGCAAQTEPETFSDMAEVNVVLGNTEKMQPATWAGLAPDLSADRACAGRRHHVGDRNRWPLDRRVWHAQPRLCAGPERLRPSLHVLHHPLRSGQFAVCACGRRGGSDQAAGGEGL